MIEKRLPPESEAAIAEARSLYDGRSPTSTGDRAFLRRAPRAGLFDSSLVVVTADHGEAFFEHRYWEHARPWRDEGPGLYQEIVHVPLLVKRPNAAGGAVVDDVVSQMDIFPTLLEAAEEARESLGPEPLRRSGGELPAGRFRSFSQHRSAAERRFHSHFVEGISSTWPSTGRLDQKSMRATRWRAFSIYSSIPARRNLLPEGDPAIVDARETLKRYLQPRASTTPDRPKRM
jgi:hypothetical protein